MQQFYSQSKRLLVSALFCFSVGTSLAQAYVVTKTADDGTTGTLRDAITQLNIGGFTSITFAFSSGTAPFTITLTSDLPQIINPVAIDGYSEASSVQGTIAGRTITVNIDGGGVANNGLDINASGSVVDGLAIYGAKVNGILVEPGVANTTIWGNYIGTKSDGLTTGVGNVSTGISVGSLSDVASNTAIVIGTNGDGTNDANEGNLIGGNGNNLALDGGIVVYNTTSSNISGNIIGLDKNGTTTANLSNKGSGIAVADRSTGVIVGTNGDNVSDALEQNIVSNNSKNGVWVAAKATANRVAGNIIGLTSAGAAAGNTGYGVSLESSTSNIVGTNADGIDDAQERNFISGNSTGGVLITAGNLGSGFNVSATGNVVAGNTIGLALDNSTAAANAGDGIFLNGTTATFQVANNIIGSDGSGTNESVKGNIIASNSFNGVNLTDATTSGLVVGNRISKNSIYNNGSLGILLANAGSVGTSGVTPNQSGGFDATGNNPNGLLNFPVITNITSDASSNIIFQGFARPGALVEFYVTDKSQTTPAPPTGLTANFGQGKTFLFQALQGGTLNGIADGGNVAGSYTNTQEGTGTNGSSPITVDKTFSFTVPSAQIGIGNASYTFSALAIDAANTSGNANNTSGFGGNMDASFTTLPVTLVNFSGREDGGTIDLKWTTTNELNNLRFDVQRSADGVAFTTIGEVAGQGSTNVAQSYTFTDAKPNAGNNFYRLNQIDIDGHSTYSKVIAFRTNTTTANVQVFPTVFTDNLNLTVHTPGSDELVIRLIDPNGRLIQLYRQVTSAGTNSFSLSAGLEHLAPGTYVLSVAGRNITFTQQVIKQ